ncbi:unnamed protein product [Bursaphelenchus xylophilus]|uniref:Hexosyltransferase n=1 Tax=Bursaphelenchus xylophilus TaxID=6326 RepID=A0A7I8X082_BURXY|nr:unnamed protein product [Bursaphelenchus xylophilus]CAG9129715.1 unnamed protein product [Bursaphelenchus xylophilus]
MASGLGVVDFLYEEDFTDFKWCDVNVKDQVQRELNGGLPASEYLVNDMENIKMFSDPLRCQEARNDTLLIIVKTGADRIERRNAYRATLSRIKSRAGWNIQTVFVMGHHGNNINTLIEENKKYMDMIIGDFRDHYYNNSYKLIYAMKTAMNFCSEVPFLLSLDDDYIINIDNVIRYVSGRVKDEKLYAGWRMYGEPYRYRFNKFGLTLKEYPYNLFPPFITGGMVFWSPLAVKEFYTAMKYCKMHKFDDVWMGILAYLLDYHPQSLPEANVHRNYLRYLNSNTSQPTDLRTDARNN